MENIQLAKVQIAQGNFTTAERILEIADKASDGNSEVASLIVYALGRAGDVECADAALAALAQRATTT